MILKNKTQGNFTIVSQNITKDTRLGLTERGLLLTILSLPDGWSFSIAGLQSILPDGKDKISNALNKLLAAGYITKEQGRTDGGEFAANIIEVHDSPIMKEEPNPHTGNPSLCNPSAETPSAGNPPAVNPSAENLIQYNNNKINNQRLNNNKLNNHQYARVREGGGAVCDSISLEEQKPISANDVRDVLADIVSDEKTKQYNLQGTVISAEEVRSLVNTLTDVDINAAVVEINNSDLTSVHSLKRYILGIIYRLSIQKPTATPAKSVSDTKKQGCGNFGRFEARQYDASFFEELANAL